MFNPFDTAVTLKYYQGPRKWYEWVKHKEYYRHPKSDMCHVYSVRENCNVQVFPQTGNRPAGRPNTDLYIDIQFSCGSKTV